MADNPNLTAAQVLPGFYGSLDYNSGSAGAEPNNRALVFGIIGSTALRSPNQPFLVTSQQQADDDTEAGSDLACALAAAMAQQPEAQGAELYAVPLVEPSGGVASVYKLKVIGTATKDGSIDLSICSLAVPSVGFTSGDVAADIATDLAAAIQTLDDKLPIGTVTVATDVVSIPLRHKGIQGEDFPMRCKVSPTGTGITVSPAQLAVTGAASGAGSVKVEYGAQTISTAIANADTAAQIATKIANAFNAESYGLKASVSGGTTVNFIFEEDRDIRRIKASVVTTTTTTVNLGSGATDGTGSPTSYTYNGTLGTGTPSVSSALTNLLEHDAFRAWAQPWLDVTLIGSLATHIENLSNGSIGGQKQQTLTMCSPMASSVAGAIAPAVSPNLTTSAPHYAIMRCEDAPVPGMWLAARAAVARAANSNQPAKNWNGFKFVGSERSPILRPYKNPSQLIQNTDLRTYALAPVVLGPSGYLELVKGRTTSLATDRRLHAWSVEAQCAFYHTDLGQFLRSLFEGGSLVRYSEPQTANLFNDASFEQATRQRMRFWESIGIYDGAEALASGVKATRDPLNPFRENLRYPMSPVLDLDQVVFTGLFMDPAA